MTAKFEDEFANGFAELVDEQVELFEKTHKLMTENVKKWHRDNCPSPDFECEKEFGEMFAKYFREQVEINRVKKVADLN